MLAAVKGGFWEFNGVPIWSTIHTNRSARRAAGWPLSRKGQLYMRELMTKLNGAVPGAATNKTYARVTASTELGGVRPIEQEVLCTGPTTTAHRDLINANILSWSTKTYNPNPPANLDGNPLGTR